MCADTSSRIRSLVPLALLLTACGEGPLDPNDPDDPSGNLAPVAVLTADVTSGEIPLTVSFDASGSTDDGSGPLSYEWTFGDGSTGSGASVVHVFDEAGSFDVTVRVTDSDGASDEAMVDIEARAVALLYDLELALASGDYWTFAYRDASSSFTGGGYTSGADAGFLTVRLGAGTEIDGVTMYAVEQIAGSVTSDTPADPLYAVPWTHLGVDGDGSLVASRGGAPVTIFDTRSSWVGDGFFDGFAGSTLVPQSTGFQGGSVVVESNATWRVSTSGSSGGCETVPSPTGPITVCDEIATEGSEAEYFLPGVGPLAYRRQGAAASGTGAARSSLTYELVATSESLGTYWVPRDWRPAAAPRIAARIPRAFAYDGWIFFYDAYPIDQPDFRFDMYDPGTDSWTLSGSVELGGWCPASSGLVRTATPHEDRIVFTCSQGGHPAVSWDPSTGVATVAVNTPATSSCAYGGTGQTFEDTYVALMRCGTAIFYGPETDEWLALNEALTVETANRANAVFLGSSIFVLGYRDSYTFDLADPMGWEPLGSLSGVGTFGPTFRHPSTAALDGEIYATGGTVGFNAGTERGIDHVLATAARFDPVTGQWTQLDPMLIARTEHVLVALDGVLYAIGSSSFNATRSMERYVP